MWKSIQTLYLGISTVLMAVLFFCNFATIVGPDGTELSIRYYEKTPYLVLMIMTLTAHVCAVFSYKLKFLQARVCIITALLALGMQTWFFMAALWLFGFLCCFTPLFLCFLPSQQCG